MDKDPFSTRVTLSNDSDEMDLLTKFVPERQRQQTISELCIFDVCLAVSIYAVDREEGVACLSCKNTNDYM
ncbi:hypothetical protein RvY_14498 [Ramazzottius varieornatus]|uniref:Uncharacterized protein n=1 Tax=Ramazzottius varieornatus TaxID=947166 RepID=A0A1D1VYV3_RAMVA|nr:hypothetical protein RvY_14498 [Ramazzottius varieornatus]